ATDFPVNAYFHFSVIRAENTENNKVCGVSTDAFAAVRRSDKPGSYSFASYTNMGNGRKL
ncbi:hypothetical protein KV580_30800, partial [Pseudomonas chlororaphis]|nr:hypothetical protein [Pseudomonas chlororaphis]